jgi:riboflavin synthase
MFTGLVEEEGTIRSITKRRGSILFAIEGRKTVRDLGVDDSIAVDGVCLTVIRKKGRVFVVQAVEETLKKTSLGDRKAGENVNLERPLLATDRLGGHFVLGHVDAVGWIEEIQERGSSWYIWIRIPKRFRKYMIPVGSIAVDGVSLTIAGLREDAFAVSIIPHTWDVTTFKRYRKGWKVNLEFDVLGKYVESLLKAYR